MVNVDFFELKLQRNIFSGCKYRTIIYCSKGI